MRIVDTAALKNRTRPTAEWPVARRRIRSGQIIPVVEPSFALSTRDTIFTMGSCFARNIEAHLLRLGCNIPTARFSTPPEERRGPTPNHVLTLFSPPLFFQEIAWVESIYLRDGVVNEADCAPLGFVLPDGNVIDLALAGATPVSPERFLSRRQEIFDLYRNAFTAECLIMTPGLVEAWFDTRFLRYTNSAPLEDGRPLESGRYELHVLDYDSCLQHLSKTIEIIRRHNSTCKILITTSPVPLRVTFSPQDIVVANTYSKSVLRAVCEALTHRFDLVDYFPSFEAVTLSSRNVWEKDRRHITDRFVQLIVDRLSATYFPELGRNIKIAGQYSLMAQLARVLGFGRRQGPARG